MTSAPIPWAAGATSDAARSAVCSAAATGAAVPVDVTIAGDPAGPTTGATQAPASREHQTTWQYQGGGTSRRVNGSGPNTGTESLARDDSNPLEKRRTTPASASSSRDTGATCAPQVD